RSGSARLESWQYENLVEPVGVGPRGPLGQLRAVTGEADEDEVAALGFRRQALQRRNDGLPRCLPVDEHGQIADVRLAQRGGKVGRIGNRALEPRLRGVIVDADDEPTDLSAG